MGTKRRQCSGNYSKRWLLLRISRYGTEYIIYDVLYSFFSCGKERDQNFIRVSKVNPCYLEYSDGTPFIPVGPNICWERFETDETKVLQLYEQRFCNLLKMEETTHVFG